MHLANYKVIVDVGGAGRLLRLGIGSLAGLLLGDWDLCHKSDDRISSRRDGARRGLDERGCSSEWPQTGLHGLYNSGARQTRG